MKIVAGEGTERARFWAVQGEPFVSGRPGRGCPDVAASVVALRGRLVGAGMPPLGTQQV